MCEYHLRFRKKYYKKLDVFHLALHDHKYKKFISIAKKAILCIIHERASLSLLKRYGKVFFAPPDDSEEIQKSIKSAFEQNKDRVRVGSDLEMLNYDRKKLA